MHINLSAGSEWCVTGGQMSSRILELKKERKHKSPGKCIGLLVRCWGTSWRKCKSDKFGTNTVISGGHYISWNLGKMVSKFATYLEYHLVINVVL